MRELKSMYELMQTCGYACDCDDNNGYGCSHPDSEEGECHTYSCPIATDASYNDMLELDPELAKEYECQLGDPEEEGLDSEWMVQHSE